VQSLSAAQWVKFGGTGYDAPIQLHTSHPHGEALLKWPLLLHTSNSLLGGRG